MSIFAGEGTGAYLLQNWSRAADDTLMSSVGQRSRRLGLSLRLAMIALVPIVALVGFAWRDVDEARDTATVAQQLNEFVRFERAVAAVAAPAYIEGISQRGLASADRLGVDREVVLQLTGVDYESIYQTNHVELDRVLSELAEAHGSMLMQSGRTLGQEIEKISTQLVLERRLTDQRQGDAERVTVLLNELDAILVEAVTAAHDEMAALNTPRQLVSLQRESEVLADVVHSAGVEANVLLEVLVAPQPGMLDELGRTRLAHDVEINQFADLLNQPADELRTAASTRPAVGINEIRAADADEVISDPKLIRDIAQTLLVEIDYLRSLDEFASGYYQQALETTEEHSSSAEASLERILTVVVGIFLLSVLITLLVSRSILRPARRLTRRAAEISSGELDGKPLPERGPADLRTLAETMNDMSGTLSLFGKQVRALAYGDFDDKSLQEEVPGELGSTIRASLSRLADVTAQLHASEARASAIVEHAAVAIWTTNDKGWILSANDAAEHLLGRPELSQVGQPLLSMIGAVQGETRAVRPDGTEVGLLVDNTTVSTSTGTLVTVIARDITERQEFERRLAEQARHDALTGLSNRFAVLEHLRDVIARVGGSYVLFVDIDGFKSVNDSQGHAVGDLVLVDVAYRLEANMPEGAVVARLGGDEFLVVVEHRELDDVVALAEQLIRSVELPCRVNDHTFVISASVGLAATTPLDDPLDVVHRADSAVYKAKQRGRGRVEVYDHELQVAIERRADIEFALREGIAADELVMYLQPIYDLATNEVWGAEALVRWNRPGHGLVPPAEFIPIAEQSGLIVDLERWVMRRACARVAQWRRHDPSCDLRIAVNISGRHLMDGDLVCELRDAVSLTGADPRMIELELTESHLLADLDRASSVLDEIRAMGVTVAVDDFGTGFSSMSYLRRLPVDVIKVDRSFVSRAGADGFDSTVVAAMVNFGRVLDIHVVAEGVETAEQLDYVRSRGCDRAQGYLLARPMPEHEAEQFLAGPRSRERQPATAS
jgi:diguanylate cyclase (GGDEF)-like protein